MKTLFSATLIVAALVAPPAMAQMMSATQIVDTIGSNEFLKASSRASDASSAAVVRISTFMGASYAARRLESLRGRYGWDLDYLHSNLVQSPIVMQAIRASGFSVNEIVALTVDRSGAAILYADDLE